jgi:hypothetical protein
MLKCDSNPFLDVVTTTITIPDETWKRFSITVMEELGGRKKNDVITELIEGYLTEHNGVICRNCFADINLTKIALKGGTRPISYWEAMVRDRSEGKAFKATCPKCKKELTYLMSDVRPIRREPTSVE